MGRGEPRRNNHLKRLVALDNRIAFHVFKKTDHNPILLTHWDKEKVFYDQKDSSALALFPHWGLGAWAEKAYISLRVISTTRL
jgi:hypothetical protein